MPIELSPSDLEDVKAEAQRLYSLEADDIYESLGRSISFGAADQGPAYYVELAKVWLSERQQEVRTAICSSDVVRSSRGKSVSELISACVVVLCRYLNQPVEIAAVAAFVVKQGLESWCGALWL